MWQAFQDNFQWRTLFVNCSSRNWIGYCSFLAIVCSLFVRLLKASSWTQPGTCDTKRNLWFWNIWNKGLASHIWNGMYQCKNIIIYIYLHWFGPTSFCNTKRLDNLLAKFSIRYFWYSWFPRYPDTPWLMCPFVSWYVYPSSPTLLSDLANPSFFAVLVSPGPRNPKHGQNPKTTTKTYVITV